MLLELKYQYKKKSDKPLFSIDVKSVDSNFLSTLLFIDEEELTAKEVFHPVDILDIEEEKEEDIKIQGYKYSIKIGDNELQYFIRFSVFREGDSTERFIHPSALCYNMADKSLNCSDIQYSEGKNLFSKVSECLNIEPTVTNKLKKIEILKKNVNNSLLQSQSLKRVSDSFTIYENEYYHKLLLYKNKDIDEYIRKTNRIEAKRELLNSLSDILQLLLRCENNQDLDFVKSSFQDIKNNNQHLLKSSRFYIFARCNTTVGKFFILVENLINAEIERCNNRSNNYFNRSHFSL